jgi:general secretion pathway protein K
MFYRRSNAGRIPVRPGSRQGGAALIIAMLVFALSAALIVAMKSEFDRFFQRTANIMLAEQAQAYLRGAEELAAMALLLDYDQDKEKGEDRDDLTEIWAQPAQPYALDDGGWLSGTLEDLQGRFNINALATRVPQQEGKRRVRFTPAQAQFIRLLQAFEEPQVNEHEAILITESISDWLDEDNSPSPDGAEDDYYYSREPSHRAGNRPMASVSELRAVAYMTPEIYQALLPFVTVWPEEPTLLNIHTASVVVLRSLNADTVLNPMSLSDAESLVEYRENSGFVDKKDFLDNSVFDNSRDKMKGTKELLGVKSSYFLLQAEVEVADRNMRLYSVLERGKRKIGALARASGSL